MDSLNGQAERLGQILLSKETLTATEVKAEVERARASVEHANKLKAVEKYANELRILVRMGFVGPERQLYQIREVLKKIQEVVQ